MTDPLAQLPLAIHLPADETFDSFYPGDNRVLLARLAEPASAARSSLYLWGERGSGRSHLLYAVCHQAVNQASCYLPLAEWRTLAPEMLEGLEQYATICIDDVDAVAGQAAWELALFGLFNRVSEGQGRIVFSAAATPRHAGFDLPDLASRLDWGEVHRLAPLTDEGKIAALQLRAQQRGLELGDEAARFLIQRVSRDMRSLLDKLDQLDRASLVAQRRLTVPFIKQTLGL